MRKFIIACVAILYAASASAQMKTTSQDGMDYFVTGSSSCSQSKPCSVVTYLHWLGASESDLQNDLNRFFGASWQKSHPNTLVVAPYLANSTPDNNWGGVQNGPSTGMQQAVQIVKQIQLENATNGRVVVTGGSMGGLGTESAMIYYGPKGLSGDKVFSAGAAFDGANYTNSDAEKRQALCGVPLYVTHAANDTSVQPTWDRTLAQTLQGCGGFIYKEVGGGHGSWGQGYDDGTALNTVLGLAATVASQSTVYPTLSSASSRYVAPVNQPKTQTVSAPLAAMPTERELCESIPSQGTLLPCGPLHVVGSQIVSQDGDPVRLACTAWWGSLPRETWAKQKINMMMSGVNCFRLSWFNRSKEADLRMIKEAIAYFGPAGIRFILNNHANEGFGNCVAQQANGLWYDVGGATDGTDGCGTKGNVTDAKWVQDWVDVASQFKGNSAVIGYDLWNEPTNYGKGSCWGCGKPGRDILDAYTRAGNAILAVDPNKLIIAEGSQDYSTGAPQGDLRDVRTKPLVLKISGRVVYSVHEYPSTIAGNKVNNGPDYIKNMNEVWGYLITENIAPVWIGEVGASLVGSKPEEAWSETIKDYLNGKTSGGLRIPTGGQGVSFCWWMWDNIEGGLPNGTLESDKVTVRSGQSQIYGSWAQSKNSKSTADGAAVNAMMFNLSREAYGDTATQIPSEKPEQLADELPSNMDDDKYTKMLNIAASMENKFDIKKLEKKLNIKSGADVEDENE